MSHDSIASTAEPYMPDVWAFSWSKLLTVWLYRDCSLYFSLTLNDIWNLFLVVMNPQTLIVKLCNSFHFMERLEPLISFFLSFSLFETITFFALSACLYDSFSIFFNVRNKISNFKFSGFFGPRFCCFLHLSYCNGLKVSYWSILQHTVKFGLCI